MTAPPNRKLPFKLTTTTMITATAMATAMTTVTTTINQ